MGRKDELNARINSRIGAMINVWMNSFSADAVAVDIAVTFKGVTSIM